MSELLTINNGIGLLDSTGDTSSGLGLSSIQIEASVEHGLAEFAWVHGTALCHKIVSVDSVRFVKGFLNELELSEGQRGCRGFGLGML